MDGLAALNLVVLFIFNYIAVQYRFRYAAFLAGASACIVSMTNPLCIILELLV
jgi:hypothetical protein